MAKSAPAAGRRVKTTDNEDPAFKAPAAGNSVDVGGISGQRLRTFIERIERVQAEIDSQRADIKEIKSEAKGAGFDLKVINYLIRIRKQDKDDLDEFETLVDVYRRAIGMEANDE